MKDEKEVKDPKEGVKKPNLQINPDAKTFHTKQQVSYTPPPMKFFNKMNSEITPFDSFLNNSGGKTVGSKFMSSKTDQSLMDKMPNFCKEYDFLVDILGTKDRLSLGGEGGTSKKSKFSIDLESKSGLSASPQSNIY
jgi:hypothetical protein